MNKLTLRAMSRVMLSRVFLLSRHLREKEVRRLADLESEFGVSRKTLQADVDLLRSIGHPIKNSRKKGWYYTGPPPEVALSQEELFAILVAEKTVAAYQGTPFEVPLREVFGRFSGEEAPVYRCSWDFLGGAITIKTNGISRNDLEVYRRVATAVAMQRVLQIDYKGIRDSFPKRRKVYPVHLCCAGNAWYVLAVDGKSGKVKTFAISRIHRAEVLPTQFPQPDRAAIKAQLESSFGVFFEAEPENVSIFFSGISATWIAERTWHPSQSVEILEGGAVLSMEVGITPELEQWILSFGENAVVVKPPQLAKTISDRLKLAVSGYRQKSLLRRK